MEERRSIDIKCKRIPGIKTIKILLKQNCFIFSQFLGFKKFLQSGEFVIGSYQDSSSADMGISITFSGLF